MLVVPLAKPVLGAGTVLVTFEQPMSTRGAEFAPGTAQVGVHELHVRGWGRWAS